MYLRIIKDVFTLQKLLSCKGKERDKLVKALLYRNAIDDLQDLRFDIRRYILMPDGSLISLAEWQKKYKIGEDKIGKFISLQTKVFDGSFLVAAPLIEVLDELCVLLGKPVKIKYLFHTILEQKILEQKSNQGVGISPHCGGFAADIEVENQMDCEQKTEILRPILEKKEIRFHVSKDKGFIHLDVCPMFVGTDKPFELLLPKIPQWAKQGAW